MTKVTKVNKVTKVDGANGFWSGIPCWILDKSAMSLKNPCQIGNNSLPFSEFYFAVIILVQADKGYYSFKR